MRHDLLAIVLAVMVLPALVGRANGDDAVSAARRVPTVPSSQARPTTGQPPIRTSSTPLSREVLVPFDDLHVLLEGPVRRVMLSREEYETLIEQARQKPDDPAPTSALMTAATYTALLGEERASIGGEITIDVLEEGLHALALDLSGVGLRRAVLDGAQAPLRLADDGRPVIFVSGVGQHRLDLSLVCPLAADAARQIIDVQIPVAAATRFTLTAPGDVEVDASASSTAVASREVTVDEQDQRSTRFELSVDRSGEVTLVLSLNRHFRAAERLVLARSVSVAEVTESQEKLSSTISLKVLRQPIDRFRFLVPEGFDITAVDGQDLDRWTVENGVLEVQLRQPLTGAVRLGVTAWRVPARLDDWRFPRLQPEEVIGEMAVVGLLLEQTLQAKSVASDGLIPIDTQVLMRAIPGGLARDEEGFEPLAVRLLLASYAPTARYALSARFAKRPSTLLVTSNLLLEVSDANHRVQGGIALRPGGTACYRISLSVPPGWQIEGVTSSDGRVLPFDRFEHRIQIQLPGGVQPDDVASIRFEATATPPGWLDRWSTASVGFPEFAVLEATEHRGAVALRAIDDLMLRPTRLEGLAPLDEHEKAEFGLQDVRSDLAYRVLDRPFVADFQATRGVPRLTARTFSFFRLDPDELTVRAEIAYDIAEARTLSLSFLLPNDTPTALSITGLDGVMVEESRHEPFDEQWRRWTAELTEPRRGPVRLAVDFALRLDLVASGEVALPVIRAEGVAFQSGLVAIEGSESLNVEVTAHPRRVDVGELVDAAYQPGPRLLGVFAFAGDPERLAVRAVRDAERGLPSAIVQEARLVTAMSAEELGQTAARFTLLGAAQYLELELPPGATLWTITVDGQPTKPLRDGTRLLIDLPGPSDRAASLRELSVVYQAPLPRSGLFGTASIAAPQLRFPSGTDGSASDPLPIADLRWDLYLPAGYQVASAGGTVTAALPPPPPLAVVQLGRWLYTAAGGIPGPPWLMPVFARARAPVASRPPAPPAQMGVPERPQADSAVAAAGAPREEAPVDAAKQDHNALRSRARASRSAPAPSPREDLLGLRSLEIDLQPVGEPVRLSSLGVDPTVEIRLANDRRVRFLALSVALLVLWWGLTRARRRGRVRFVLLVLLLATLIPIAAPRPNVIEVANAAFFAGALLVPILIVLLAFDRLRRRLGERLLRSALTALLILICGAATDRAAADDEEAKRTPVVVPEDAIIVPYDPDALWSPTAPGEQTLLLPYGRYVELWNRAHPERKLEDRPPQVPFGLAGARYRGTLASPVGGAERADLLLRGTIEIEVYVEGPVEVPLRLGGAVLAAADLDGRPARLQLVPELERPMERGKVAPPEAAPTSRLTVVIEGRGRHVLILDVRVPLERRGGWRIADAALPAAPASALTITVPDPETEVRLRGVEDRTVFETRTADEEIATALSPDGELHLEWRPRVGRGEVDVTLQAESTAVVDVREDGVELVWRFDLSFPRSERESFAVTVPAGQVTEAVVGANVRGWRTTSSDGGAQRLTVDLLKPARERDRFTVHARTAGAWSGDAAETPLVEVPALSIDGAALHQGSVTIRRSPLLQLQTGTVRGVVRTDSPPAAAELANEILEESPLGTVVYEAYRFASVPFELRLNVVPLRADISAEVQSILRISARKSTLESRVVLDVRNRPLHEVRVVIPRELQVERAMVSGPETVSEWSIEQEGGSGRTLVLRLSRGRQGALSVILEGSLGEREALEPVALPLLRVLDVERQEGTIVVQVDPAFDVTAHELAGCEIALMSSVAAWLQEGQRSVARLALAYRALPYAGTLHITPRPADVSCTAVSNVRITDRAIEETVLLDFLVENAGIRRVSFLLPASMADARLSAPMLREKRVDEVADQPGWVRFSLELQDEIMGRFRVLLENDRLLTDGSHAAPIPLVETGRTDRRYVALENVGRDEVLVERLDSLELLSPRQREWPILISMLGGGAPEAYLVRGEGAEPSLIFGTTRRSAVQTAGARIGLAQATLMLDEHGAFRAVQTFRVDNQTEQFLEIQLPPNASLWSASVAGAPIKPIDVAGQPNRVRLPLVRTALGDLDFEVVIKYGGSMDGLGAVDFPLVRTVNINVEMSQARLFLPEDRLWFDFGGTMRLSEDAGDLEAGYLAYQTRTMQQLLETSRDANVWAKLRASSSLKSLAADVGRQVDAQSLNMAVQQERAAQVAILELAQRQIEEVDSSSEVQTMTDNRRRLNELYEGQRGARARNVVQDLHNFESQIQVQTGVTVDEVGRFDSDWIVANELAGETLPMLGEVFKQTEEAGAVTQVDIADRFAPPPGGPPRGAPQLPMPGSGMSRGMGPPVPADRKMQAGAELAEDKAPPDQERLGRYRQQLADREKETAAVVGQTATRSAGTSGRGFSADAGLGLRSLDVELPTRGREYQFTTPRGEVEITARSLPRSLVRIAVRLVLVGLGLLLAVALFRVARSWYDRGIDRRWSIGALLILGVISLVGGIFPVFGVLGVLVAIVLTISRWIERRRAVAV